MTADLYQQYRILRDRQSFADDAFDRSQADLPNHGADRIALSVFNGGQMASSGDHYFLGHPVAWGCPEDEGTPCTPVIDTNTTVAFVPLRNAPAVGDIVLATAVGGRWVAEVKGGATTVCVAVQCGTASIAVPNATVQAWTGGSNPSMVASGTTSSTGCVSLSVAGSYTIKIYTGSTQKYSGTIDLSAGGTVTLFITQGSGAPLCCGNTGYPANLTLTDALGSIPIAYNAARGTLTGGRLIANGAVNSCDPTTKALSGPVAGNIIVWYELSCVSTGGGDMLQMTRTWWVGQDATFTWRYLDAGSYQPAAGDSGPTNTTTPCLAPNADAHGDSIGQANPTSTSPFAIAFTMATQGTPSMPDPVGGTVALTS